MTFIVIMKRCSNLIFEIMKLRRSHLGDSI